MSKSLRVQARNIKDMEWHFLYFCAGLKKCEVGDDRFDFSSKIGGLGEPVFLSEVTQAAWIGYWIGVENFGV